jgi:hypothetical protein
MDLLSAGDGGSRSWHSLLWHQWVAALRAEAAALAHDPRRSPPPRRSQSAHALVLGAFAPPTRTPPCSPRRLGAELWSDGGPNFPPLSLRLTLCRAGWGGTGGDAG